MTSSPSPIEPDGLLDGLQWGCIFRGALVDILVTTLGSIPLAIWLAGPEAFEEGAEADRMLDAAMTSPEGLLWGAALGFAATSYGAFYGARRAGDHYVRHGGWVAVASALLTFPLLLASFGGAAPPTPAWYEPLGVALMLPAGILGGFLASKSGRTARRPGD